MYLKFLDDFEIGFVNFNLQFLSGTGINWIIFDIILIV